MKCVHCGNESERMRLNPWLSSLDMMVYECWPYCDAGRQWYARYTMRTTAGIMLDDRYYDAVRAQRERIRDERQAARQGS